MREILFRGKLLTNGEWSYGNLDIKLSGKIAIITPDDTPIGKYGQVDPATIGQYTGLTDRNGVKIFEGYILSFKFEKIREQKAIVEYSAKVHAFLMTPINDFQFAMMYEGEVIGNIHDNQVKE